jgi:hypothetical protein
MIDDEAKKRVAEVLEFARGNLYRPGKSENVPGDDSRHVVYFFLGFRAVFSFTEGPDGLYRHLTVSVDNGKYPSPLAAFMIADAFGFTGWKLEMGENPPPGWMGNVDEEDSCVTLFQRVSPSPSPSPSGSP